MSSPGKSRFWFTVLGEPMSQHATDTDLVKLHVANGIVWFLNGSSIPQSSGMDVLTFLDKTHFSPQDGVRLMGSADNARLITELFARKLRQQISSVEVVTPLVCSTNKERSDPLTVLYWMRQFHRVPSLGGFHEITERDYPAYAMVAAINDPRTSKEHLQRILYAHPVWTPLSFVNGMNAEYAAKLISLIIDPRWYIDLNNPDRVSKLEAFLGLVPKTQAGVSEPTKFPPWRHHDRCQIVLKCWKDAEYMPQVLNTFKKVPTESVPIEGSVIPGVRPADFLWRVWYSQWLKRNDMTLADLRASQYFIRFLRNVWLSEIYRESPSYPLFRAQDFFRQHLAEAEAYNRHISNKRGH
jgi:hypothetical protein